MNCGCSGPGSSVTDRIDLDDRLILCSEGGFLAKSHRFGRSFGHMYWRAPLLQLRMSRQGEELNLMCNIFRPRIVLKDLLNHKEIHRIICSHRIIESYMRHIELTCGCSECVLMSL